jgi:hypothetical protein
VYPPLGVCVQTRLLVPSCTRISTQTEHFGWSFVPCHLPVSSLSRSVQRLSAVQTLWCNPVCNQFPVTQPHDCSYSLTIPALRKQLQFPQAEFRRLQLLGCGRPPVPYLHPRLHVLPRSHNFIFYRIVFRDTARYRLSGARVSGADCGVWADIPRVGRRNPCRRTQVWSSAPSWSD